MDHQEQIDNAVTRETEVARQRLAAARILDCAMKPLIQPNTAHE